MVREIKENELENLLELYLCLHEDTMPDIIVPIKQRLFSGLVKRRIRV